MPWQLSGWQIVIWLVVVSSIGAWVIPAIFPSGAVMQIGVAANHTPQSLGGLEAVTARRLDNIVS